MKKRGRALETRKNHVNGKKEAYKKHVKKTCQ